MNSQVAAISRLDQEVSFMKSVGELLTLQKVEQSPVGRREANDFLDGIVRYYSSLAKTVRSDAAATRALKARFREEVSVKLEHKSEDEILEIIEAMESHRHPWVRELAL